MDPSWSLPQGLREGLLWGQFGLGGSHSVSRSAFSPKQKEPTEEAESVEVAEREVRWAEPGGKVPRVLGLVPCAESQMQTPKALVLPPGPQE